jgi:hypothetical protein
VAAAYVGFRSLSYTEFGVLNQVFFAGDFRRLLRLKICLKEYQQSLAFSNDVEGYWLALRQACREAEFTYVAMSVNNQFFEDEVKRPSVPPTLWSLQAPLGGSDFVIFKHDPRLTEVAILIAPMVEGLRAKLGVPEQGLESMAATMRKSAQFRQVGAGT